MLWTALANLGDSHGVYFDQWIICNHAAVAFWQQHVYLNFIDPDEYLATENKMTVPQMIKTCFGEGADMYRFLIYNIAVRGRVVGTHTLRPLHSVRGVYTRSAVPLGSATCGSSPT